MQTSSLTGAGLDEIAVECGTDKCSHWHGYTRFYERYLGGYPDDTLLIEIGVAGGGSLAMWRKWRPKWRVLGIDIDDASPADIHGDGANITIVPAVLRNPDILIDDGSHKAKDVRCTFDAWWPLLNPGGVYVVEDLHCSFDENFVEPGEARPIDMLTRLAVNCIEGTSGMEGAARAVSSKIFSEIESVHFHKSIAFVFKKLPL